MPFPNTIRKFKPIAIVGLGAIFPGASNANQFWRNIVEGKDLVKDVPPTHWLINDYYDPDINAVDKTYCKRGAFLPDVEFDPLEYGIPPMNLNVIDTSQLLALIVAKQVLEDTAGIRYLNMDLSRVSVILGAGPLEALQYAASRLQRPVWAKALREAGLEETTVRKICDNIANSYVGWQENNFPGLLSNVVAGRIANRFNLGGTNCTTDAACAGSIAALSMAVNELQLNQADMVISGGVDTLNDILMYMCFSKTHAMSLSNDCRPFDADADGTILGEGVGLFALKRLDDAERDNNKIYAVIRGIGTSSDGRSKSIYAPRPEGQSKAIQRAYEIAGYEPETVGLIEAHGTATNAGDVAEFAGLLKSFPKVTDKPYCALGSIKSQIGHTKSTAGAAGLFKAAMALSHKVLPPTIKITKPNPKLDFKNSPFYLNTTLRPWIKNGQHPRRAGVSAFGFGGSNFHLTLEEYTGPHKAARLRSHATELVIVSAENPAALIQACKEKIKLAEQESLSFIAPQSQKSYNRSHLARMAVVACNAEDLKEKLQRAITLLQEDLNRELLLSKDIYYGYACDPGRVAFLFPGQGSQYVGMGDKIAMSFDSAMQKWDQAAREFDHHKLQDIVFPPPVFYQTQRLDQEKTLTLTQHAQPALAVTDVMYFSLLTDLNIRPDFLAGHSFGELVALHAAGAMDEQSLFRMSQKRGELAQQVSPDNESGMLSVAHPVEEIRRILKEEKIDLAPANFNSPRQLILSGQRKQLEKVKKYFDHHKIQYKDLPVSAAFHSPVMKSASKSFKQFLEKIKFNPVKIPVFSNETADIYPETAETVPTTLSDQLIRPVRFQEMIEKMYQKGVRTFIEVGPKNVLTGLVKACLPDQPIHAIPLDAKSECGIKALWHALAKLFVIGLNPTFDALNKEYAEEKEKEKSRPHSIKINGTNYGKPYPPSSCVTSAKQDPVEKVKLKQTDNRRAPMSQSLLQAYQELHRQLIEAHNTYQKTMADTHISFLNAISQISQQIASPGSLPENTVPPVTVPSVALPTVTAPAPVIQAPPAPPITHVAPPPIAPQATTPPPAEIKPATPAPAPAEQNQQPQKLTTSLKDIILELVVEKTGYPRDMLNMDMSIETDLGIDSIKRVEILSALTEKLPHLPQINASQLGEIQTLGHILSYAESHAQNDVKQVETV